MKKEFPALQNAGSGTDSRRRGSGQVRIMRVSTNISALTANSTLKKTDNRLAQSIERLSSGYKVNHAKDNPAGLAISKRMMAQIKGISIAGDNASEAVSIVETADGALAEIHDILHRMTELSVEAANGTKTTDDRKYIDAEIQQLKDEINRIADTSEFNGKKILNGDFDLKAYSSDPAISVMYYSDDVPVKKYEITGASLTTDADGNTIVDKSSIALLTDGSDNAFPDDATVTDVKGTVATIKASGGFEMKIDVKGATSGATIDVTGIGAMRMQIGANEGQVLEIRVPEISLKIMGLTDMNVTTTEDASEAIDAIEEALNYVSLSRARLGAYQNRLENAEDSLDLTEENLTKSYSRIMDVDMAEEMTNYTTQSVLSQAGTQMLAQANERPQQVLQLLQ